MLIEKNNIYSNNDLFNIIKSQIRATYYSCNGDGIDSFYIEAKGYAALIALLIQLSYNIVEFEKNNTGYFDFDPSTGDLIGVYIKKNKKEFLNSLKLEIKGDDYE